MSVVRKKVETIKKGDIVYKDGKEYTITNIKINKGRYSIVGTDGYYAELDFGRTLPIKK